MQAWGFRYNPGGRSLLVMLALVVLASGCAANSVVSSDPPAIELTSTPHYAETQDSAVLVNRSELDQEVRNNVATRWIKCPPMTPHSMRECSAMMP